MRPTTIFLALAAAAVPALQGCSSSTDAHPAVAGGDSTSVASGTAPVENRLTVPDGMQATVIANVEGARALAVGPDGAIYVSQPTANQITRLVVGSDGVADAPIIAVSGLNRPHGMAFHDGWFYIANTDGVVRVKIDSSGHAVGTPEQVNHYSSGGMHWTRSITFGPDGRMYVAAGSDCNVCVEKDSTRAAVMQYDENGKNGRVYARGLRNAVGIAFNPATGDLWVSQNERDNIEPDHQNLPPEELNIIHDGGDYGWPYCYGDRIPNPEFNDQARCANTIPPALEMQAHSAPLSLTFLKDATQLPAAERGDALIAFHGSWDRDEPTGAKVVRVHIQNNTPVSYDDFITGWQGPDGKRWGRPVDVAVLHDGSLVISDNSSGEIIRVATK